MLCPPPVPCTTLCTSKQCAILSCHPLHPVMETSGCLHPMLSAAGFCQKIILIQQKSLGLFFLHILLIVMAHCMVLLVPFWQNSVTYLYYSYTIFKAQRRERKNFLLISRKKRVLYADFCKNSDPLRKIHNKQS